MGTPIYDKWQISALLDLYQKGRLNLQPEYQRANVWDPKRRYDLIDTVRREWPIGQVLLNLVEEVTAEGTLRKYDVIDGQQRLSTLFEYKLRTSVNATPGSASGAFWSTTDKGHPDFQPYVDLPTVKQNAFDEFNVPPVVLSGNDLDEIRDIFSRHQAGKPLTVGERVKALPGPFKPHIQALTRHKLFDIAGKSHKSRDAHWNLAAQFIKAAYHKNALERVEFNDLDTFIRDAPANYDTKKAETSVDAASKIMNYVNKMLEEAVAKSPDFEQVCGTARLLKWTFAVVMSIQGRYAIAGREHLAAEGLLAYYAAKETAGTQEWEYYLQTGRTGRIDTDDVKRCLEQLTAHVLNAAQAEALDKSRYFSAAERAEIFTNAGGSCQDCGIPITATNFHADHIIAHAAGGATDVKNGQALCTTCNLSKGSRDLLFDWKSP